ncbi:MAG: hypothetical protein J6A17_03590 [Bacilli bacterium]|nr:hypothetical protein [Bacilli bacterium]
MLDDVINNANSNSYNKEEWKKKKQEQLQNAYNMIEEATEELKNDSSFFKSYLDVQSRFDKYTVRNALLLTKQLPNATQLKDYNGWKEAKVNFKTRYPKRVVILEPGEAYTNKEGKKVTPIYSKEVIDISETNLKPNSRTYDKKLILQSLLHNAPADIKAVDSLEDGKMCNWDKDNNVIYVCRSEDYNLVISSVAKELANINLYENTNNYDQVQAECISYMICKKYGIDTELENIDKLSLRFSNMESKDIKDELSNMKNVFEDINNNIGQYLDEKLKDTKKKDMER